MNSFFLVRATFYDQNWLWCCLYSVDIPEYHFDIDEGGDCCEERLIINMVFWLPCYISSSSMALKSTSGCGLFSSLPPDSPAPCSSPPSSFFQP